MKLTDVKLTIRTKPSVQIAQLLEEALELYEKDKVTASIAKLKEAQALIVSDLLPKQWQEGAAK